MIRVENLTKKFKVNGKENTVLNGINLSIERGEIFGVIGPSGAGKSTLIRCINLLEKPSSGKIIINGVNLTELNPRRLREERRKIGMIFQHFNLLSSRTVYGNVALPLEIAGVARETIKTRVLELLNLVGLEDRINYYPSSLSGGQKQRVGIARALANNPDVLLCDEPTSALDPQTTRAILNLLNSINKQLGLTIILITHEMQVIKEICNRVAVLQQGKIIEEGPTREVFSAPRTTAARNMVI